MPNQILDGLDPLQRAAASATSGPVAILAVAGAGKTRTITHRIAYAVASGAQDASRGLALSYTTKSAAELRLRISALGVEDFATSTIHGAAWRQLRHFWPKVLGGEPWQVMANRNRMLEKALEMANLELSPSESRSWLMELERRKAEGFSVESYLELDPAANRDLALIWGHYNDLCMRARVVDFDDVIQLTLGLMEARPDILTQVQNRYTWFTVDEYQDITPLQEKLLQTWVGKKQELCVVGDATQSIYEFAGAAPQFLISMLSQSGTKIFELDHSYRCPQQIAEIANPIARWLGGLEIKSTETSGDVALLDYADDFTEQTEIVQSIKSLLASGHKYSEIAVLLRTTQAVQDYVRFFEDAGLPVVARQGLRFTDSKLVKQALLILKTLSSSDALSIFDLVQSAVTGLGWKPNLAQCSIPVADWIGLNTLVEIAAAGFESVDELLESIGNQLLAAAEPKTAAITINTIHQAKGLEWETVFLPRFLDPKDSSDRVIAEHARIQFVGLTRSRKNLQISFSHASGNRSRFLSADLPSNPISVVAQAEKVAPLNAVELRAELCEKCGVGIAAPLEILTRWCRKCQPTPNAEIKTQIETFRTQLSAELAQPEWLILSDNSVLAVSIRVPKSVDELKQIHSFARLPNPEFEKVLSIFKLPV